MHVVKTGMMKKTCCDHLNPQAKCAWKLQIFHCHWFHIFQGGRCMEEFLLPVAIPHAKVRADKEIPFLGSYLAGVPHVFTTFPLCFTAFLPLLLKVCYRQDKKLFREFPQIISQRVCLCSPLQALSELCPVSKKAKSHVHPINKMQSPG